MESYRDRGRSRRSERTAAGDARRGGVSTGRGSVTGRFITATVVAVGVSDRNSTDSPLEAVSGGDSSRAAEAFGALSNETRLAILLALWEAYSPAAPDEGVSFSELRQRVDMRNSGRFNYHLGELEGQFVRKTDDGYVLRRAGRRLVRTVIAGTGIEEPTFEASEIDVPCPICDAATEIRYEDDRLYQVCTECQGAFEGHEAQPEGYLAGIALDPAGFTDRTAGEMWAAARVRAFQNVRSMIEGVCDECSGPAGGSLAVCDDHDPDGVCEACGRRSAPMAFLGCSVCKNYHVMSPRTIVAHHPAVVAFYHEHGVDVQFDVDDFESVRRRVSLVGDHDQEVVSTEPPRVRVVVSYDGDELRLTVDEELDVTVTD